MPTFEFRGYTRTIARAVVDTMVPRWPDYEPDITDQVLLRVEQTVSRQPLAVQTLVTAGLWGLEFGGPAMGVGLMPLTRLDREARDARLTAIAHHPIPTVRRSVLLYQTLVNLCAYSMPEIEAFLGAHRRDWREDRRRFRDALLVLDEGRPLPPVPAALADPAIVEPARYLEVGFRPRREAEAPGNAPPDAPTELVTPKPKSKPRAPRKART